MRPAYFAESLKRSVGYEHVYDLELSFGNPLAHLLNSHTQECRCVFPGVCLWSIQQCLGDSFRGGFW